MKKLFFLLLMISGITSNAQDKFIPQKIVKKPLLPIAADCNDAIKLKLDKYITYGPTVAPTGFGTVQEIQGKNKKTCYGFEQEHNSAWYYFDVAYNGNLLMEIIPVDSSNDYDFMIFKYTDSSFCDLLAKQKILPIRSNISRSGKGEICSTGLSAFGKANLVHAGPGETFSKPLEVKKGERYYLVLDNVYPDGLGHTIRLGYEKVAQLSGVVLNEENKPIQSDIILEDSQGKEIQKTKSDAEGKYSMDASLWSKSSYTLSFFNDSSFVNSKVLSADLLEKTNYKISDIKTILPKLRGGKKYILGGINFYGGTPELVPQSYSSVYSLGKLMKKNKKMTIRIEGHINFPGNPSLENMVALSEQRALAVYNMLLLKGIEKERMSTIGFGSMYMLFPLSNATENQQAANRRVEINVLSLK